MTQLAHQTPAADDDIVVLRVPASSAYLGVLRTATAGLAARLQFALDEIEDLRIAVDEASAMLLSLTAADAELCCRFTVDTKSLTVATSVSTASAQSTLPGDDSFAWQVLNALTDGVASESTGGTASIQLTKQRPTNLS